MAISNTNLLPLLAFITTFLMLLNWVNSESLSFDFPNFDPDQLNITLILEGNATIDASSKTLQIPKRDSDGKLVPHSVGRAYYSALVPLWESSTVVASFETTFTFNIKRPATGSQGDGITFFLVSPDHPLGDAGGQLGLFTLLQKSRKELAGSKASLNSGVVAVEYDTFSNPWDPSYTHVGIDVNSIVSANTSSWESQDVLIATAQISYDSATKTLSAVTTYPIGDPVTVEIYDLELQTILPEFVRVGFTGSTGDDVQLNQIISWSFSSTLESSKVKKKDLHIASVV